MAKSQRNEDDGAHPAPVRPLIVNIPRDDRRDARFPLLRRIAMVLFLFLLIAALGGGFYLYQQQYGPDAQSLATARKRAADLERENIELKRKHDELQKQMDLFLSRLKAERRVAKIWVAEQNTSSSGNLRTKLNFMEVDKEGEPLTSKEFWIEGKSAYIDTLVIKFDGKLVQEGDPQRGHSIALFKRIFDENHSPVEGDALNSEGQIPLSIAPYEKELWSNFTKLMNDPAYAKAMGVRVAQKEAVARDFDKGMIYKVTLEANGGLNIIPEPMSPEMRLSTYKQSPATAATTPAH